MKTNETPPEMQQWYYLRQEWVYRSGEEYLFYELWDGANLQQVNFGYFAPDSTFLEVTPAVLEQVAQWRLAKKKQQEDETAKSMAYQCETYNDRRPYQRKGQTVRINGGSKKHAGKEGVVFWEGNPKLAGGSSFRQSVILATIMAERPGAKFSNAQRIGLKTATETIFVDIKNVEVIDGFFPVGLDLAKAQTCADSATRNFAALGIGMSVPA